MTRGILEIERERLAAELERYATAQRQRAVAAVENWWDKYRVSLRDIEAERDKAMAQLDEYAMRLGYAA